MPLRRRGPRLLTLRVLVIGAVLAVSACGGPQASSSEAGGASTSPEDATPVGTPTSAPTVLPTAEPPANPITWILGLAPGAPAGPPEFQAYELVLNGDCVTLAQGLQPDGELRALSDAAQRLYGAVADACLAALHGQPGRWAAAEDALQALASPVSCLDVATYELLQRLVDAHRANPSGPFEARTDPASAAAPPCPTITQLDPNHGPSGTRVRITGMNLDHVVEVLIYFEDGNGTEFSRRVEHETASDALIVTLDDDTNIALWACIVLQGAPGWNGAGARFTIDGSPGAAPSQSDGLAAAPTAACPPPAVE